MKLQYSVDASEFFNTMLFVMGRVAMILIISVMNRVAMGALYYTYTLYVIFRSLPEIHTPSSGQV